MSMPDHRPEVAEQPSTELVARPKVHGPTRAARVGAWFANHFGELGLTITFGVLAVLVSPWFALAAGLVALLWTVHEYRVRRSPRGGDAS